jgi:hypothetical protein
MRKVDWRHRGARRLQTGVRRDWSAFAAFRRPTIAPIPPKTTPSRNPSVGAHPVRDKPAQRYIPTPRSRTSALLQGVSHAVAAIQFCDRYFCGSAPCARQTYGAVHPSVAVAHRVRSHRQAPSAASSAPSVTQSRCAARPRLKSSAIRVRCAALGSTHCVPSEVVPLDAPRAFGLIPARCCGRYQAIFFGLLFFWASKRKVTRAAAAVRNARRVGGTLASR